MSSSLPVVTAALSTAELYHTGLVVPDLLSATAHLTAAAGYEWTTPVEADLTVTTSAGDYEVPFRFVYSLQAPCALEVESYCMVSVTCAGARALDHPSDRGRRRGGRRARSPGRDRHRQRDGHRLVGG